MKKQSDYYFRRVASVLAFLRFGCHSILPRKRAAYAALLCLLPLVIHADEKPDVFGVWDGFYSGTTNALGSIKFNFDRDNCFIETSQVVKDEKISFQCDSLMFTRGYFTFATKKKFSDGHGWVETRYRVALTPHITMSKVPRQIIGTWIQGLMENENAVFIGLNTGTLAAKELLDDN